MDSVPTKKPGQKAWELQRQDFWPHGGFAALYGLFREVEGHSERANVLIDEAGKVAFVRVYPLKQLPPIDEVTEEIKSLG